MTTTRETQTMRGKKRARRDLPANRCAVGLLGTMACIPICCTLGYTAPHSQQPQLEAFPVVTGNNDPGGPTNTARSSSDSIPSSTGSSLAALATPWLQTLETIPCDGESMIDFRGELGRDGAADGHGEAGNGCDCIDSAEEEIAPDNATSDGETGVEGETTDSSSAIGDFEREVMLRVSDYKADLREAMKQAYDRWVAARVQRRSQEDSIPSKRTRPSRQADAQVRTLPGYAQGAALGSGTPNVDPAQESEEMADRVSVDPISPRSLKRMDRELSKKRRRLMHLLSNYEQPQQVYKQGLPESTESDESWGETVAQRRIRRRSSIAFMESPLPVNTLLQTRKATQRKLKVSASGRLSNVHRDLKGGGKSDPALATATRLAARKILKTSLLSDGTRRTLRSHARRLVLALMYAAAVSIALRMLTWALWLRR